MTDETFDSVLFTRIQDQISARSTKRNLRKCRQELNSIFSRHAEGGGQLDSVGLSAALQELMIDSNDLDCQFYGIIPSMGIGFDDFVLLVESESPLERIAQSFPFWKLLADDIPRAHSNDSSSENPLKAAEHFTALKSSEIECLVAATADTLKEMLIQFCTNLKGRTEPHGSSQTQGSTKFSIDTYNAGSIQDFHNGLSGRVGELMF